MNDFLKAFREEEKLLKKLERLKKKSLNSHLSNSSYFNDSKTLDSSFKSNDNDLKSKTTFTNSKPINSSSEIKIAPSKTNNEIFNTNHFFKSSRGSSSKSGFISFSNFKKMILKVELLLINNQL